MTKGNPRPCGGGEETSAWDRVEGGYEATLVAVRTWIADFLDL